MIAYLRDVKETVDFIDSLFNDDKILGCCSVSVTEVYAGMKEKERITTEKLVENIQFFPVDLEIAKMAGNIIRNYRVERVYNVLCKVPPCGIILQ